jgi:hypothetical protein
VTSRDDDRIGMRPADLDEAERQELKALLGSDLPAARAQKDAEEIAAALRDLPRADGPSIGRMRARLSKRVPVKRPTGVRWGRAGLLAALAALVLIVPRFVLTPSGIRDGSVLLDAATTDGRVVFTVTTKDPGWVVLVQEGRGVVAETGGPQWLARGVHVVGPADGIPVEPGLRGSAPSYRALLCEDPEDARRDSDRCASWAVRVDVG